MTFFFDELHFDPKATALLCGWCWITAWTCASCALIKKFYKNRIAPENIDALEFKLKRYKLYGINVGLAILYMSLLAAYTHLEHPKNIVLFASIIVTMPNIYLILFGCYRDNLMILLFATSMFAFSMLADIYLITQMSKSIFYQLILVSISVKAFVSIFMICMMCCMSCVIC